MDRKACNTVACRHRHEEHAVAIGAQHQRRPRDPLAAHEADLDPPLDRVGHERDEPVLHKVGIGERPVDTGKRVVEVSFEIIAGPTGGSRGIVDKIVVAGS